MLNQVVELKREVTAVQIPSGDVLTLPEGERAVSYTHLTLPTICSV